MGEPLHNYDNVMKALSILHDPAGLGMSMSRITLSTVGLIPEIDRLGKEELIPNLAVSVTGALEATRDQLMPINQTYPIRELVECLRRFPLKRRQRITLEYVMLKGVTDSPAEAKALARIARKIPAKINLIPLNEAPDLDFRRPEDEAIQRFQQILRNEGIEVFLRKSRGDDISAACGQLKKKWADSPPGIDLSALAL
jgi:23S rRNA (adenine2503-C2)-methyltransferase